MVFGWATLGRLTPVTAVSDYGLATVSFNYFQFGAARRGLAGSIVYLLNPDIRVGAALFYVLSIFVCTLLLSLVLNRIVRPLADFDRLRRGVDRRAAVLAR